MMRLHFCVGLLSNNIYKSLMKPHNVEKYGPVTFIKHNGARGIGSPSSLFIQPSTYGNAEDIQRPDINYEYIYEYYDGINWDWRSRGHRYARANLFIDNLARYLKPDDIVIIWNSNVPQSRLIQAGCEKAGATYIFTELGLIFPQHTQFSFKPLLDSPYGEPELNTLYNKTAHYTQYDIQLLNNIRNKALTKFDQSSDQIMNKIPKDKWHRFDNQLDKKYDIFIVGQVVKDTNLILPDCPWNDTNDFCIEMAEKYPDCSILYKPHPRVFYTRKYWTITDEVYEKKNVTLTSMPLTSIYPKVEDIFTVSSSVGLEAQFFNKHVTWWSDISFGRFDLSNELNRYRFIQALMQRSCANDQVHRIVDYAISHKNLHR